MTTISACIITREVDDALRRAVDCIRPLVDEVVIAYNSTAPSTEKLDNTKIIHSTACNAIKSCKGPCGCKYGDIIDFSVLRNTAHRAATGEWMTWLDTDDTVEYSDVDLLRKLAARGTPVTARYDYQANDKGEVVTRFDVLRLAPREFSHWYLPIHELLNCPGPYAKTEEIVWKHHKTDYQASHARNYRICRHWQEDPRYAGDARFLFFAAQSYEAAGNPHEALPLYRRSFVHTAWVDQKYLCAKAVCDLLIKRQRPIEAVTWAYNALEVQPNWRAAYHLLGRAYLEVYKRTGDEAYRLASARNFETGFGIAPSYSMLPVGEPGAEMLYLEALGRP